MLVMYPVKEQVYCVVRHFFFGNINGGEHRFCLLRFQYVIDGDNGRNVAFFAVALQTVKNAESSAVICTKNGEVLLVVR